jgi:hypothetical protein
MIQACQLQVSVAGVEILLPRRQVLFAGVEMQALRRQVVAAGVEMRAQRGQALAAGVEIPDRRSLLAVGVEHRPVLLLASGWMLMARCGAAKWWFT